MSDYEKLFDELVYAVHRLNVDWDELAHTCGDLRCSGDCVYVETVRRIVGEHVGTAGFGALPAQDETHSPTEEDRT